MLQQFLLILTILFVIVYINISPAFAQTTSFLETFTGQPSTPEAFTQVGQTAWDVQIHSRNADTWDSLSTMDMHHGPGCEPPLTTTATAPFSKSELVTHPLNGTYEDAVFKCKDHVMTSINGIGKSINDSYGLITLTPNHMVDFANGEATIKFNVTTYRTTQRDWIDVWITPWDDNLNLPFDSSTLGVVDLQGAPRNAVLITMFAPNNNAKTGFRPTIFKNGTDTGEFSQFSSDYNWYTGYEDFLPGNAGNPQRRDTFEIKISKTHISICMPQDPIDNAPSQTLCWANKTIGTLPFTRGVVQFAHHSYTPNKDCGFYSPLICGPDTWHWDDIYISPAVPFTMIKANKRMVTSENDVVTFNQPAPANAKLRFTAAGNIQLSFNNGAFQAVTKQPGTLPSTAHVASYFVTIPQGTTNVKFRMTDTGAGGVHAKDFAIWSQAAPSITPTVSTNTPTPTLIPRKPGNCDGLETNDNDVDIFDYNIAVGSFGSSTDLRCDFAAPLGQITIFDYNIVVGNFGT